MKLKGRRPGIHIEPIVLPRPDGDLVFHAKGIEDFEEFEKLCPPPEPPAKILPGGEKVPNPQDQNFLDAMQGYGGKRVAYMVVKGLSEGTEDLEWETVSLENHHTWTKYREELRESGLSDIEVNRIVAGVMRANSLSEVAVEEARKRFLASQQAHIEELSSQKAEQSNTPSGELASE
jgi:hypothetical protein